MRIRLYTENKLASGETLALSKEHGHYLTNVLRCKDGAEVFVFNNDDGEFRASYVDKASLALGEQSEAPQPERRLTLLFAPVKFGKIDYLVQKATELGVTHLQPVQTRFTVVGRINYERLRANAIEAAEQTGRITVPEISEIVKLEKLLDGWDVMQKILFCDESLSGVGIASALAGLPRTEFGYAVLIGPEGGFAKNEVEMIKAKNFVVPVTMGKRLLRAETAAIAALAVVQGSVVGDWS